MFDSLNIGIVCFPGIGGSGIVATELGMKFAGNGHQVHFISYDRPFRLNEEVPNTHWHVVETSGYSLFRHEDYTLPLAVKISEVCRESQLDILHVHYAVPHAVAAYLAAQLLGDDRPAIVTTLHGTDTTLIGKDPSYRPVVQHALEHSDALTAVSTHLADETRSVFGEDLSIEVIHNFYEPKLPKIDRAEIRAELDVHEETPLLVHMSNLRGVKRIDLLFEAFERINLRTGAVLLLICGDDPSEWKQEAVDRGLEGAIRFCSEVLDVDSYLNASDLSIYTSEKESFGLSVLEGMFHSLPTVAFDVGGLGEVLDSNCGRLVEFGDVEALTHAACSFIEKKKLRLDAGKAGLIRATHEFSPNRIIQSYVDLYRQVADVRKQLEPVKEITPCSL